MIREFLLEYIKIFFAFIIAFIDVILVPEFFDGKFDTVLISSCFVAYILLKSDYFYLINKFNCFSSLFIFIIFIIKFIFQDIDLFESLDKILLVIFNLTFYFQKFFLSLQLYNFNKIIYIQSNFIDFIYSLFNLLGYFCVIIIIANITKNYFYHILPPIFGIIIYLLEIIKYFFIKVTYSRELSKIIHLYIFYNRLNLEIGINKSKSNFHSKSQLISDKYYLINSNWLDSYKAYYNYEKIKEELNNNKEIEKIIYILNSKNFKYYNIEIINSIIHYLPKDIIEQVEKNEKDNNNNDKKQIIFDKKTLPLNYYDNSNQKQELKIYDNYEIIDKKIADLFLGKKIPKKNFSNCYIYDNHILCSFVPNNKNINKYYSLIGDLDKKNIITPIAVLIYDKEGDKNIHIIKIKNNYIDYIEKLDLINGQAFIKNDQNEIIGILVKL